MAVLRHARFILLAGTIALLLAATWALVVNRGASDTPTESPNSATSSKPNMDVGARKQGMTVVPAEETTHDPIGKPVSTDNETDSERTGATISGTVFDTHGRTMEGMTIGAEKMNVPEGHGFRVTKTDEDGAFRLRDLTAGTYHLIFLNIPIAHAPAGPFTVAADDAITGIRLVYQGDNLHVISGRVTNGAGEPLQHATMSANLERGSSFGHAITDESGNYTIKGLSPGTYRVDAHHADYTHGERAGVQADSASVNFVLTGRGSIEGRVVDASNGQPITKFKIGASTTSYGLDLQKKRGNLSAVSDPLGNFLLNVEAMDSYLMVEAEGYVPSVEVVSDVREGATVSGIEIRLEPGATIEGQVLNKSGQPVANAKIYAGNVMSNDPNANLETVAQSDENGYFQTKPLDDPSVSIVTAVHGDYAPSSSPVTLSSGKTTQVIFELSQGGTVQGKVTVAGQPASAKVQVNRLGDGRRLAIANTDSSGLYVIERVSEGEVRVSANVREEVSDRFAHQEAIVAKDEVTVVDFDFAGGNAAIEGYVTIDGQPIARAHVNASAISTSGVTESFNCDVDDNGFYQLQGMSAGNAILHLIWQDTEGNQQGRSARVDLFDGQVTQHDFEIAVGTAIVGSVSWEDDSRVGVALLRGEMDINAVDEDFWSVNEDSFAAFSMVRPDGTFHVGGLETGNYTIVAFAMAEETSSDLSASRVASQFVRISGEGEVPVSLTLP